MLEMPKIAMLSTKDDQCVWIIECIGGGCEGDSVFVDVDCVFVGVVLDLRDRSQLHFGSHG